MIRKTTAIFFILLANIVLLVHAFVPHHYHKSLVCIESSHCQSDSYSHNHSTSAHNHEHDGSANCVLKQAVLFPGSSSIKQELEYLDCKDNHSPFGDFQAVLFSPEFNSFVPKIISIAQIPLKASFHSCFVHSSLGLRAPPTV